MILFLYPPSQKTTGLPVDECEVNASADVAKGQARGAPFDKFCAHNAVVAYKGAKECGITKKFQ